MRTDPFIVKCRFQFWQIWQSNELYGEHETITAAIKEAHRLAHQHGTTVVVKGSQPAEQKVFPIAINIGAD